MTKILLLTDFSSGYSRNLLKGIVRYAKKIGTCIPECGEASTI